MARVKPWLAFSLACAITILAGRWALALIRVSEFVHFSANFPTVAGSKVMPREELGGPWSRLPDQEWSGYPAGGLLAWGREGKITIDLGRQGFFKRMTQPHDLILSSHWLRNVGTRPYRLKLELELCGMPITWETFERDWDPEKKCATRSLRPGKTFNMDWSVRIPRERFEREVVCEGELRVRDAETNDLLTFFPVKLKNSRAKPIRAREDS